MAPPGRARLRRLRGSQSLDVAPGTFVGLYAHRGGVRIPDGGSVHEVPPATLAWCLPHADTHLQWMADEALWMEVMA